jgi:hypothetical protein
MFGSATLEVVIGVVFLYILVSIICTVVREGIEGWFKARAAYLEHGIRELLHCHHGEELGNAFYNHPLIFSLFAGDYKARAGRKRPWPIARGGDLPSYIPASNFAVALMDIAARGPQTDAVSSDPGAPVLSVESIRKNVLNVQNEPVRRVLLAAIDSAQGDLSRAQASLEAWYDSAMDRVSGRYKRSTQWVLFWIGLAVAVGLNINTITVVEYLHQNEPVRAAMVHQAEQAAADPSFLSRSYEQVKQDLKPLGLPIGWGEGSGAPRLKIPVHGRYWADVFVPVLGWLLTAFAATLGAPFWFDVLNKVMVIRSTVKPHEKSPEESSEDRQLPRQRMADTLPERPGLGATAGGPVAAVATQQPANVTASPRDQESSIDGCQVGLEIEEMTNDEDLPAAEGGVA